MWKGWVSCPVLKRASETLKEAIKQLGIEHKINQARAIVYWDEVVGKRIAAHAEPYLVRDGILFVSTSSSTWSQELSLIQPRLLQKLNQYLGEPIVKQIRFQSRGLSKGKEPLSVEEKIDLSEIKLTSEERAEIEKQVSQLSEESLREELRVVLARDRQLKKWRLAQGWQRCKGCGTLVPPKGEGCPSCGENQP